MGHRRPQQPHERLLVICAARAFSVDRRRPAVARLRERTDDSAALVPPRVGPLLQSARPAHHRGPDGGRHAHRRRSPAVELVVQGRSLAPRVLRHRGRAPAGDRPDSPGRRSVRSRVRAEVGQLERLPVGRASRRRADLRQFHCRASRGVRAVHAGVRGAGNGCSGGSNRRGGSCDRPGGQPLRDAQLARRGRGQSVGLADHPLSLSARRSHGIGRNKRGREPSPHEQVRPQASEPPAAAVGTGTSCSSRASSLSRSSR